MKYPYNLFYKIEYLSRYHELNNIKTYRYTKLGRYLKNKPLIVEYLFKIPYYVLTSPYYIGFTFYNVFTGLFESRTFTD